MREIKFRAWLGDKMVGPWEIKNIPQLIMAYLSHNDPNLILMQFTGLKDKAGKEIYEGDVLSTITQDNTSVFLEIIFSEGCFKAKSIHYVVVRPPSDWCMCEIVGNIYETKPQP